MVLTYNEARSRSFSFNSSCQRSVNGGCPSLASTCQLSSSILYDEEDEWYECSHANNHHNRLNSVVSNNHEDEYFDCSVSVIRAELHELAEESTFQAQLAEDNAKEMELLLHQQLHPTKTPTTCEEEEEEEESTMTNNVNMESETFHPQENDNEDVEDDLSMSSSIMNLVVTTHSEKEEEVEADDDDSLQSVPPMAMTNTAMMLPNVDDEQRRDQACTALQQIHEMQAYIEQSRQIRKDLHQQMFSCHSLVSPTSASTTSSNNSTSTDNNEMKEPPTREIECHDGNNPIMNLVVTTYPEEDGEDDSSSSSRPLSPVTTDSTAAAVDTQEDLRRKRIVQHQIHQIQSCIQLSRQMRHQLLQTLAMTNPSNNLTHKPPPPPPSQPPPPPPVLHQQPHTIHHKKHVHFISTTNEEQQHPTKSNTSNQLTSKTPTTSSAFLRTHYNHPTTRTFTNHIRTHILWSCLVVTAFLLGMITNTNIQTNTFPTQMTIPFSMTSQHHYAQRQVPSQEQLFSSNEQQCQYYQEE